MTESSDRSWAAKAAPPLMLAVFGLVLLVGIFIVRLPHSPWYVGLGDDGALFAYGGQRIVEGEKLYEDIWDTKPPGVFYLNALAIGVFAQKNPRRWNEADDTRRGLRSPPSRRCAPHGTTIIF